MSIQLQGSIPTWFKAFYHFIKAPFPFHYKARSHSFKRPIPIPSKSSFPFRQKPIPIPLQSPFPFHYKVRSHSITKSIPIQVFTKPPPFHFLQSPFHVQRLICTSKANSHSRSMSNQFAVPTKPQLSHHLPLLSFVIPQATPTPKHPVRCHSYDMITK